MGYQTPCEQFYEVYRQPVRSVADLQAALRRTGAGRPALLLVRRGDGNLFVTVRPRG